LCVIAIFIFEHRWLGKGPGQFFLQVLEKCWIFFVSKRVGTLYSITHALVMRQLIIVSIEGTVCSLANKLAATWSRLTFVQTTQVNSRIYDFAP